MDIPTRPLQFSLRSLLLYVTASAVAFAVCKALGFGYGFAVFCMACILLGSIMVGFMASLAAGQVTVAETDSREEAAFLCELLLKNGIPARIHDGELPEFGMMTRPSRVIVPAQECVRARQVLEQRTGGDD